MEWVKEKMLVGGTWRKGAQSLAVYDPESGKKIAEVPAATKDDVQTAVFSAKNGAAINKKLPIHERSRILQDTAAYIDTHFEVFVHTIISESSKTIKEARKEVNRCMETLRLSAEESKRLQGETIPFSQMPGHEKRVGYVCRDPIGVIAAITPFNDPLNLVAHKVGPAIAAGNSVIVKPSTLTPLSTIRLAEAFLHAGLPAEILSVITGKGSEICDVLVEHDDVRFVSFTGGYETGRSILEKTGVKKTAMELGSNSPTIVLADSNIEEAVAATVAGAFGVAGQNCISVQRIYVIDSIYSEFIKQYTKETKKLKIGSKIDECTDIGPMISEKEAVRVENWIQEAESAGAELCCGGKRVGAFLEPTVLTNVPDYALIAKEEVFGPVVIINPVSSFNQAIELANDSRFGLQAGLFTSSIDLAFQAIERLDFGAVMINDSSDVRIDSMPFGGVKHSGIGREGVRYSIEAMTERKVVAFHLN